MKYLLSMKRLFKYLQVVLKVANDHQRAHRECRQVTSDKYHQVEYCKLLDWISFIKALIVFVWYTG